MELSDSLLRETIDVNMSPQSKTEWVEQLVALLVRGWGLRERDAILRAVLDREATHSTAIGGGVAVPHAKTPLVPRIMLACGIARDGVAFDAPDGEPVHVSFLLLSPTNATTQHVRTLSSIGRIMMRDRMLERMLKVSSPRELLRLIRREEGRQ